MTTRHQDMSLIFDFGDTLAANQPVGAARVHQIFGTPAVQSSALTDFGKLR
jgi:hypothetical protein